MLSQSGDREAARCGHGLPSGAAAQARELGLVVLALRAAATLVAARKVVR
jgi:hypothetical protein